MVGSTKVLLSLVLLACIGACKDLSREELLSKLKVSNITLPAKFLKGQSNWRIWGTSFLSTRLYNAPLPDGSLLVGWTDNVTNAHVSYLKEDGKGGFVLKNTVTIPNYHMRGLAAGEDTSFGVLLWNSTEQKKDRTIHMEHWSAMEGNTAPKRCGTHSW